MRPPLCAQRPIHLPSDVEEHLLLARETHPDNWADWREQAACRMTLGEGRSRLAHPESLRHVADPQGARLAPPRVFAIMSDGRQKVDR